MGALAGLILGVAAALFLTGGEVTLVRMLTTGAPAALVPLLIIPLAVLAVATQAARLAPAKALRGE